MRTIIIIAFLACASMLMAQFESPFGVMRHSSVNAQGNMHLRWDDFSEGMGLTECLYNVNNGNWNSAAVDAFVPGTMEALVPYSFGTKLRYRLRYNMDFEGESFALLHAAYWDANSFPPPLNKMAYIATDAQGDSVMVYNPNLDLRESYMATTTDKLYMSIKNVSGVFPTMNSVTSYNVYLGMITNVEAENDSVAYGMIYSFNIPGLISNGLYKLGMDAQTEMPTFTRLGNIQAQVSAGTLHMACDMSDLTADPDFGAWPNMSNTLILMGMSMAIDITLPSMEPTIGMADYSNPANVVFQDNFYQVAANTLPAVQVLSWDSMAKVISFNYFDQDNDFPLVAFADPLSSEVVQATPLDPMQPANSIYVAQLPFDFAGDVIGYTFSDNGIDMITGTFNPSSNDDVVLLPKPIVCTMPNPVRSLPVEISFKELTGSSLQVDVFNLRGQKVGSLFSGAAKSGELSLNWDGRLQGKNLASGVYFLRVTNGKSNLSHKFVITK